MMHQPMVFTKPEDLTPLQKAKKNMKESLFLICIAFRDSLSVEYVRLHGTPTVGDPDIDRQMLGDDFNRYANAETICAIHAKGAPVRFPNQEDSYRFYVVLQDYLVAWRDYLHYGMNTGDAPIEELIRMDGVAERIYGWASTQFGGKHQPSQLEQNFRALWVNRGGLMVDRDNSENVKPRESLAPFFQNRLVSNPGLIATTQNQGPQDVRPQLGGSALHWARR